MLDPASSAEQSILKSELCKQSQAPLMSANVRSRPRRWFDSLEYNWEGLSKQPNLVAKAKRSVWQFFPHTWDSFHWQVFSSPLRCLESLAPIIFILIAEVRLWCRPSAMLRHSLSGISA